MKLHQNLPAKQKRLAILLTLVSVLSLWSFILPPTDPLDYDLWQTNTGKDASSLPLSQLHNLQMSSPDLQSWDLPITLAEKPKIIEAEKKPKIQPKSVVNPPAVVIQAPSIPYQPPTPTFNFPQIKYLGQVTDEAGMQIFLTIDDSNLMMRPKRVYEQTWQIIAVNDYEVRLQHIPTQKILNISKL